MLHRIVSPALVIAMWAAISPTHAAGPPAPAQIFGVCASPPALPTIYVSGVLQTTAAAAAGLRTEFTQFLAQTYGYHGAVVCAPAATAAAAEQFLKTRTTALRNAKKNVIETGWVGGGAPAAALAGMLHNLQSSGAQSAAATTPTPPATGGVSARSKSASGSPGNSGSSGTSGSSGGSSGSSELAGVLASIFGSGCGGGTAAPKTQASATGDASKPSDSGGGGCQAGLTQVSNALSSAFSQKSKSGTASAADAPAHTAADGLGSAKAQNTRLVVYGCGRQDKQVACVTELTNQNQADTLMQSADLWKDTFVVDDRGDRHPRSHGFFLNIDGEQRTQLDVSYGKSARFILMFDDVQARVQKVTLRSQSGGLDVEDIDLITTGTAAGAAQ